MKKLLPIFLLSALVSFAQAAADLPKTTVFVGAKSVVFSVTINAGAAVPLTYVWRKDGTPLTAASLPTLTLTNILFSQAGSYDVVVSNADGSTTSNKAPLDVVAAPIKNPPVNAVLGAPVVTP